MYWNVEEDKPMTENDVLRSFDLFGNGYTFPEYLERALEKNGSLRTMESHIRRLEAELTRYAGSYEPEEIREKQEEISLLKRMYMEV